MISRTRNGSLVEKPEGQEKIVEFLYKNPIGRQFGKLMIHPWLSRGAGWLLERSISRIFISSFVRKNRIDMTDYPVERYRSFNDFFTRSILPDKRPIDREKGHLISPCDGKLTVIPIEENTGFCIKGVLYTAVELLRDPVLAESYRGGWLLLFRLSVDDYHRYCYPADGVAGMSVRIPGVFHTVQPLAAERCAVYWENTREYILLETEEFGSIVQMEVGALLVGRITNDPVKGPVERGQKKGRFEFGGSAIVLMLKKNRVEIDADILNNSRIGAETIIKMGEKIAAAIASPQQSGPDV